MNETVHIEILNRWTGEAQFACDLETVADESRGQILGRAALKARECGAVLRGAVLSGADLSGAVLSDAVLSGADLRGADLSGAVLSGAVLSDAVLSDADLSGADLRGAVLRGADLRGAVLRGADWIPKIPDIHRTVYEAVSKPGALNMGDWHTCETTHCRAGWVVTLAGAAGRVMEGVYGTATAAALIYQVSDPTLAKVPDFYCGNGEALADMARLAGA